MTFMLPIVHVTMLYPIKQIPPDLYHQVVFFASLISIYDCKILPYRTLNYIKENTKFILATRLYKDELNYLINMDIGY